MLRSYLTLAYRNLVKNRLASILNVAGLWVAIGANIIVFLMEDQQGSRNTGHVLAIGKDGRRSSPFNTRLARCGG